MLIPFFSNPFDLDFTQLTPTGVTIEQYTRFSPKVDISEDQENYYIEADIPGFQKEDLQIQIENNILILKGKKEQNIMEERKTYLHRERISSHFDRKFKLPENTDPNTIEADFQNQKLLLKIPKTNKKDSNKLNIKIN